MPVLGRRASRHSFLSMARCFAERGQRNASRKAFMVFGKRDVGSSSQADHLVRNTAMDDSIGGS